MPSLANVPRIEALTVENYRALRNLKLTKLDPLTVFLGPNGSGKSTVFDVFAFLSECFTDGLRRAWDRRGRFRELRSRGSDGRIAFELKYRENGAARLITYRLEIEETAGGPVVAQEWLQWKRGNYGRPFRFLNFANAEGEVITGESPEAEDERVRENLQSKDLLAVNTLGQLARNPRIAALRQFVTGWHLSYLSTADARSTPESGPQERLSKTGDNLANVMQHLRERHPDRLEKILGALRRRVPRLQDVSADVMPDGRLLLRLRDAPFGEPVLAKYASDGTLKMLAYLTLLYDPDPPRLVGIEEPENHLHPRLLPELAEECDEAASRTQLMVTTHSPFFVNQLRPEQLWALYRDEGGYTQARRASQMPGVSRFVEAGGQLGHLWMEGYFDVGDPLVRSGGPRGA